MLNEDIKLYMIPGTGTDKRMFAPQLEKFPSIIIPEWLPPQDLKEPLESYANRLAATIDTSSPFILGGVSLGGMLAQQMATKLKPLAVILIATGSTSKALPLSKRLLGKLTRALPDNIVKFLFKQSSKAVLKSKFKRKQVYANMLEDMPPRLVRWQSGAATEWALNSRLTMPVFHIHGDKDGIIPIKNVKSDTVVKNGGHLINVTHENEVNAFIAQKLSILTGS